MPYDAIICDIDGCLSPEASDPMDTPTLERVSAWNRASHASGGPVITPCSGRPEPFVEAMCRLLGNRTVPSIAENGAWLFDPSDNSYELDPRISEKHLSAVIEASAWVRRDLGPRGVTIQPGKAASISLYHPDHTVLRDEIIDLARETFEREGWPFRVSMTWFYVNCDLAFVSKSTGIDRLIARKGYTRERLAGIGDTPSDLTIREHVAWFACPSNADEELKQHADYVSDKAEAEGVLDILGRLDS